MKSYVYRIRHIETGQFYIGSKLCRDPAHLLMPNYGFGVIYKTSSDIVKQIGFEHFVLDLIDDSFETYDKCFEAEQLLILENIKDSLCLNQACYTGQDNHPYRFHKFGRTVSEETRLKISNAKLGKKRIEGPRKPHSKERIEKIKLARNANPHRPHVSKLNKMRLMCPHCLNEFNPGNYANHHGDKCKLKLATIDTFA